MGKRILIGSMLVFAMLLLMPSIPAIQQNIIKEEGRKDFSVNFFEHKTDEIINYNHFEDRYKHPFLFIFILLIGLFRMVRGDLMIICSSNEGERWWTHEPLEIYYPLIYARGCYLSDFGETWLRTWKYISNNLGWNWWT